MLTSDLRQVNRAILERLFGGCEQWNPGDTIGAERKIRRNLEMAKENDLLVIDSGTMEDGRLTRRKMVQRLLAGAGAGAAWPLVATSHPIYELLRNDAILAKAEKLGDVNWKPVFLSPQQNETLAALAESIVPGSTKAQVSRFVDLLLSVDKPENQHKFVESLTVLDAEAQKRFAKGFPSLDEKQKNMILTDVSTKTQNQVASKEDEEEEKQFTVLSHFENLKGWISGAYYSSEPGMRELGWTGNYAFAEFPGCTHPEGHA
jgi:gluconate 2-dehydrogenase subunit 3-like protein